MRLALSLGPAGMPGAPGGPGGADGAGLPVDLGLAVEADRLGYDAVWVPEAYGSDAPTVLAWIGATTTRIRLGSGVLQIPGRSPAMTAMTAATLDALSGGRFRLGLGISGPHVSEGWHGVRFDAPLQRTREYVEIVRLALDRRRLQYAGQHWTLPLPDGAGKALRLTVRPVQQPLPIYLAALGPRNVELAGELADGWLAVFLDPEDPALLEPVRAGAARAGRATTAAFDVVATVPVVLDDDLEAAGDQLRAHAALYLGGMGSREVNFYARLAGRMGYAAEVGEVQEHYLAGRPRDAAAAVPFGFLDRTALLGSPERIRDRLDRYAAAGVTTLSITPYGPSPQARTRVLRTMAELVDHTGPAS